MKQILGSAAIFVIIAFGFIYCIFIDDYDPKVHPSAFPVADSVILDSNTAIRWVEFWKPKNVLDNDHKNK